MAGYIMFHAPKAKSILNDQAVANRLVKRVREQAAIEGINVPKSISIDGMWGSYISISYTTKVMRELVLAVAKKMRLKVRKVS